MTAPDVLTELAFHRACIYVLDGAAREGRGLTYRERGTMLTLYRQEFDSDPTLVALADEAIADLDALADGGPERPSTSTG